MGYFVKSLILHIFIIVVFSLSSYLSFKDKTTLNNVALISASELKQKQAEFKKQTQELQKQKAIKEQQEKKKTEEKKVEKKQPKPKPKTEKAKEEPKKVDKKSPKPKETTKEVAKKQPREQAELTKSKPSTPSVTPRTENNESALATLPLVEPRASKDTSGEISGNFDFDAMATTPEPQVAEEPKQEEKPIAQEIEQEDTRQAENEEFNSYLDSVVERADASASSSASAINKDVGLTKGEYDILVAQIKSCWFFRGNAPTDSASLNVTLKLAMNRDATVRNIKVVGDYNSSTRQVLLRHATNALKNPSCVPLKLPLNKYEIWKETTINFSN